MSSSIPGRGVSAPGSCPRSAPVAHVSRTALAANAGLTAGRGIRSFSPSILRADAWGHGDRVVRDVLRTAGLRAGEPGLTPETLYGLPGGEDGAQAVLRLTGTVLSVKDLRAGEGVSYGYAYRAPHDTRVALVTGGYAQGLVRRLGGAADAMIGDVRHPLVGRIAMDVCVVEIGDADVRRGDDVLLLGDGRRGEPSLADWMEATGFGAGELVTTVGLRALREEAP